jgi:hypothetical protein
MERTTRHDQRERYRPILGCGGSLLPFAGRLAFQAPHGFSLVLQHLAKPELHGFAVLFRQVRDSHPESRCVFFKTP